MDECNEQPAWYRRPLPAWVPAWLLTALTLGAGVDFLVSYGLHGSWVLSASPDVVRLLSCLGLCTILTAGLSWAKIGRPETPSPWAVPVWLGAPSQTALLCLIGWGAVLGRGFKLRYSSPGLSGPVAVGIGILLLLGAVLVPVYLLWNKSRRFEDTVAAGLAIAVFLAAVAWAALGPARH